MSGRMVWKSFSQALFQCMVAGSLIQEETELGDEADIGQCHIVADEEHPIRPQGLLDAGGGAGRLPRTRPWHIVRWGGGYRATPDADPIYLYTDDVIGILPKRNLTNRS
jgi:hypothetical protein